ncbi:MAG: pyridoxamine 5'-phosphate oxidase family protein [Candidatus Saliniplasma sp.]
MTDLPEEVIQKWDKREGPAVFTTVNENGEPNAIYVSCIRTRNEGQFVIADNYFDKTRSNIKSGSHGSILFITEDHESFQIKGTVTYHTAGEIYEEMKYWLDSKFPGHAAAVLNVERVYQGAKKLA